MLVEGVAGGGDDAPAQAELLVKRFPEDACQTLVRGAQAATNSWVRTRLIAQIAALEQKDGSEFLHKELLDGPFLATRVAAAYGLTSEDRKAALAVMAREWVQLTAPTGGDDDDWEQLAEFLASRDSVEAISVLTNGFVSRPLEMRLKVVESLGEPQSWGQTKETPSDATRGAIEAGLVAALEDTSRRMGMSGSYGDKDYSDPRICDIAAHFLWARWPDRYQFDLAGPLASRERQRLECLNVWRTAHGTASLPLPKQLARLPREQACHITMIDWSLNSAALDTNFAGHVDRLKGKPLKAEELIRLFSNFVEHSAPGCTGLEFSASKDRDLTGVRLTVQLFPGRFPTPINDWEMDERVTLGREDLFNVSGGLSRESVSEREEWEAFTKAAQKAIKGPAETNFEISVRLKVAR